MYCEIPRYRVVIPLGLQFLLFENTLTGAGRWKDGRPELLQSIQPIQNSVVIDDHSILQVINGKTGDLNTGRRCSGNEFT